MTCFLFSEGVSGPLCCRHRRKNTHHEEHMSGMSQGAECISSLRGQEMPPGAERSLMEALKAHFLPSYLLACKCPVYMRKVIPGTHCDNPCQQTALSQPGDLTIIVLLTPQAPSMHRADRGSGDRRSFRPHFPGGLKDSTRVSVVTFSEMKPVL